MKKYAILITALLALTLYAQPIDPEPVVDVVLKKIDAETLEVKTTTTTVQTIQHDKAMLQTELDHIPDQIAVHQEQIVALNERAVELQNMLDALN